MEDSKKIYAVDEVSAQIKDKTRRPYLSPGRILKTSTLILNLRTDSLKRRPLWLI
jgi:hypothetical protein